MSVEIDLSGAVAVIRLNRPEVLNALSFAVLDELDRAIAAVEASPARGLVFVGTGPKAFCAGADIVELMDRTLAQQREGSRQGQAVFSRIAAMPIPSVAVIHGFAFGGGLELAMACTFRVATPAAKMGLPEIKLGLIPGYGGTQRLPRLIGEGRALDLVLSGRSVGAEEAERIGLVTRVVEGDDPVAIGRAFLEPYLKHGLLAARFAREAVSRGMEVGLDAGLSIERDLSTLAYRTEDAREGMLAFVQKRPAVFKDA